MEHPETHAGFARVFPKRGLSLGLFFAIESYRGDTPTMRNQEHLARRAEELGFAALWFRDVPLRDPTFGDVGQIYDPWVYLGHVGAITTKIALVTGAIVLPLRHPLHVAKAAASVDVLSNGRMVVGLASGDRAAEYAAFGIDHAQRGTLFREHLKVLRRAWADSPELDGSGGKLDWLDTIPKPAGSSLPVLVTGRSQQTFEWIAANADGFVTYPRPAAQQADFVASFRAAADAAGLDRAPPVAQSLYIDLLEQPAAYRGDIHLGYALGRERLVELLGKYLAMGIRHVALNLKYGRRPAHEVVEELGQEVLPFFRA